MLCRLQRKPGSKGSSTCCAAPTAATEVMAREAQRALRGLVLWIGLMFFAVVFSCV